MASVEPRLTALLTMPSLRQRLMVFVVATVVILVVLIYGFEGNPFVHARPNVIGATWYGAALFFAIPALLVWVCFAIKSRIGFIFSLLGTTIVIAIFVFVYVLLYRAVRTMPGYYP